MAWDTAAAQNAANVIAKVEGAGAWDAINLNDPLTVGLMQWFGTRGAALLKDMKDNGEWGNNPLLIPLSLELDTRPVNSSIWTARWLTGIEARALKPILRANKDIQSALVVSDMEDYRAVAERIGMNPDTNTKAVQFYCCMYHQTPARANRIVNAAGAGSSLDRIYAFCMNDPVFGRYRSRYTDARNMIRDEQWPEIIELNDDDSPGGDSSGGSGDGDDGESVGNEGQSVDGIIKYLSIVGDQIVIRDKDNQVYFARPVTPNRYIVQVDNAGAGVDVPNDSEDTGVPDPPPFDGDISEAQEKVRSWALSHLGSFGYTNDSRRVDIEASGWGDCSAFTRAAYKQVGVKLGMLTSNQYTQGKRITTSLNFTESQLRVGDLLYIRWKNPGWNSGKVTDHVEIYIGNNTLVGHPGPGRGGRTTPLSTYRTLFRNVYIQRHIN